MAFVFSSNSGVLLMLFLNKLCHISYLIGINRQDFAITSSAKEHFNVVFSSGGILFLLLFGRSLHFSYHI